MNTLAIGLTLLSMLWLSASIGRADDLRCVGELHDAMVGNKAIAATRHHLRGDPPGNASAKRPGGYYSIPSAPADANGSTGDRLRLPYRRRRIGVGPTNAGAPMMSIQRTAISALFVAGLAALPLSAAKAQYYGPPCNPFPLTWPFCIVGAAVGTAATIATAPFRAIAGGPYYYYGQPYYAPTSGGYYGSRYQPLNRPSASDHVARQLNRQELYGY